MEGLAEGCQEEGVRRIRRRGRSPGTGKSGRGM